MSTDTPLVGHDPFWNHSSDPNFLRYYEQQSVSDETLQRFSLVRDKALQLLSSSPGGVTPALDVVDVGCGAGTQSRLWAEMGHRVHGLDVNEPLVSIAIRRAAESGLEIAFDVGSATELPYADASMDVALLPELLEHVANWQGCLDEAIRVLRPGGLLYLSTTSWLCPKQQEFNLPLYSWYPAFLKRRYERLAVTTRPEIANHCKYPAVNWFSFYALERYLGPRGFACLDRFDMVDLRGRSAVAKLALTMVRSFAPLRLLGHVFTPGSTVFALKAR
jgi:ubiquinone/menaquinone biosynthesis C-methylase UbiE